MLSLLLDPLAARVLVGLSGNPGDFDQGVASGVVLLRVVFCLGVLLWIRVSR